MRLRADINVTDFIRQVEACRQDVFLETDEDSLDLKSTLSQYVFVVTENNKDILENARVICTDDADYETLSDFLEK